MNWIDAEEYTPDIRERVLIYPIDGSFEAAEYIGEGRYTFFDFTIPGEHITHWARVQAPQDEGSDKR